ncbi:MAG: hypothetical protein DMD91_07670 [Candidatus Rokuibacteriota bacterium]|nr:MAG: hypothetical protein DMD91_07670 [Candidatus Rokubacteria bacterium]
MREQITDAAPGHRRLGQRHDVTVHVSPHVLVDPLGDGRIEAPPDVVSTELAAGHHEGARDQHGHRVEAPPHEHGIDHDLQQPEERRAQERRKDDERADHDHR